MKKIIITEQQFKRLVENIVLKEEEDFDDFNNPRKKVLINFLNE